jgi:hypothetical protein
VKNFSSGRTKSPVLTLSSLMSPCTGSLRPIQPQFVREHTFQCRSCTLILTSDPYHAFYSAGTPFPDSDKPTGVSWFPHEIFPAIKHVIEKECDLVFFKEHGKGGHFAALECPKEFWEDVEEFATMVWGRGEPSG